MMNRVRNAHAWAALLLLAAACDGGGGGGDDEKDTGPKKDAEVADAETDGETPEDDGGGTDEDGSVETDGGGDTDAGEDATVMMDGDIADTGVTPDTGVIDTDAGTDAGPMIPANCAETAVVAATGATITSTDTRFSLALGAAALSVDSTVRVCVIASASAPAGLDGRVGDAYEITTTPAATFTAATATFRNHSGIPVVDATPVFDAPIVRALPAGGAVANGTGAVLRMSKRTVAADTATTLSATVAGPGHVYVGTLEAPGVYHVNMHSPTKTTFVTGEIIDFGTTVTVTGAPVGTRVFEAEANGCDLDPLSYPPNGTAGGLSQPAAVLNNATCTNGAYVSVRRNGGAAGNIVGAPGTGTTAPLAAGTTLDLQAAEATPLGFYCRFPGAGKGAARLLFKTGATTDLEIIKDIEVACAFSGELVALYDTIQVQPNGSGSVDPIASPATAFSATAYASIAPPAITATALGDGAQFAASAVTPPLSGTGVPGQIGVNTVVGVAATPQRSGVNLEFQTNQYVANPVLAANPAFYAGLADAVAHIAFPARQFDCGTASMAQMDLRFGPRANAATTVAVTGSTVDFVWIQARIPAAGAAPATVITRLLDAAKLTDHQTVPLLDAAQRTAVGVSAATEYTVGYFKVVWDERRFVYDQRILPIACGTALRFEAADVAP